MNRMDEMQVMYTPYYDRRIERKWSSGIGFALLALTVLALLGQLLAGFLAGRFFPDVLESTWGLYLLSLIPMYIAAVPAYWGILQLREKTPVVKRSMGFGEFCLCFLMCMPLMYGGNLLGNAISGLLNNVTGLDTVNQVAELMTASGMLPTVVFAVILAPIVEELVFRKLLCDRMRRYGDKVAILVSGIVFGLYHGNLYQFFYAAAIGIFFAFLYCRTGRVVYTILLHMLINFVGSVVPMTVMELCGDVLAMAEGADPFAAAEQMMGMTAEAGMSLVLQTFIMGGYGLIILGGSAAGAIALIVCRKRFVCMPGAVMIPKGQWWSALVWNPGGILAAAALLATLVLNTLLS